MNNIETLTGFIVRQFRTYKENIEDRKAVIHILDSIDLDLHMKLIHKLNLAIGELRNLNGEERLEVILASVARGTNDPANDIIMLDALQEMFGKHAVYVFKMAHK